MQKDSCKINPLNRLSKLIPIKTILRASILLILILLLLSGIEAIKYFLVFYLFILFFEPKASAVYFLILILILPFLIYFKKNAIAEYYAIGAYLLLSGGIIGHITRKSKLLEKILIPVLNNIICYLAVSLVFVFVLLLPFVEISRKIFDLVGLINPNLLSQ